MPPKTEGLGKSYSNENSLRESIFREDLFYTIGPWDASSPSSDMTGISVGPLPFPLPTPSLLSMSSVSTASTNGVEEDEFVTTFLPLL